MAGLRNRKVTIRSRLYRKSVYSDFNHLFMAVPGTGKGTPADLFRPGHVALSVIDNVADWIDKEQENKLLTQINAD